MHVSFKVLTRISRMILQIFDVPSHFQESPVWNYFDFQFWGHGIHEKVSSSLSNYRLYADVYNYMNIRTVDPLLKHMHEFSLKIFYGGLRHLCDCIFSTKLKFIEMYEFLTTFILHFVLILVCGYINNQILEYYLPLIVRFCY